MTFINKKIIIDEQAYRSEGKHCAALTIQRLFIKLPAQKCLGKFSSSRYFIETILNVKSIKL